MSHGVVLGRNCMNACALSLDLNTLKMVTLDAVNEKANNQLSNNSAIPIESDKLQIKTMGMSIGKNEKFNDNANKIVRDEVIKEAKIDEIVSDTVSKEIDEICDTVSKEIDKIVSDTVSKEIDKTVSDTIHKMIDEIISYTVSNDDNIIVSEDVSKDSEIVTEVVSKAGTENLIDHTRPISYISETGTSINDDAVVTDGIVSSKAEDTYNEIIAPDIFNINYLEDEKVDYICGEKISHELKCQLRQAIEDYYVNTVRPKEPLVKCEIKLSLEKSKPFSCAPRRLSYNEKDKLQQLLDEYLKNGIIRPSDSVSYWLKRKQGI
ncbi:uncharacterized protein LOC117186387 isoform X1 [Drosophila miranda]|uniref:uncharacterized protein LOC117186387 isoform X1 n=1 Tax=Drosophila miranda TaxID=7229 RepID=UPI00143FB095|nr:uncharacterized protein LOC117186387 isoform X1 [Drosophila miranda]